MYYIKNQNNQIIAADPHILDLLKVESIDELYKETVLGNISFKEEEEGKVTITAPFSEEHYDTSCHALSGIWGQMTLVALTPAEVSVKENMAGTIKLPKEETRESEEQQLIEKLLDTDTEPEAEIPETGKEDLFFIDDLLINETETEEAHPTEEESPVEEESSEEKLDIFDDTIALFDEPAKTEESETAAEETTNESPTEMGDELFDLLLPDEAGEMISEIVEEEAPVADTSPIFIDTETICREIGISEDDYNTFLNEYIDTALSLEEDLRSTDIQAAMNAIHTLTHLSNVLHLPAVTQSITEVKNATEEKKEHTISSFYTTLNRLTTNQVAETAVETVLSKDEPKEEPATVTGNIAPIQEESASKEAAITTSTAKGFGTIDLSDVAPIHFDFRMEEAANDLSLPLELIEEFVHDFIEQAHEETERMLKAYEEGDLETVQKIGHLLKGTSSNLRITPLSETLYKIQFCEDSSNLEALIKDYWGHFLSLENQINLASR